MRETSTDRFPAPVYNAASRKYWVGLVVTHLLIPLVLFICAWDLSWWQGWLYSVLIVGVGVGSRIWAEKRHPGFFNSQSL